MATDLKIILICLGIIVGIVLLILSIKSFVISRFISFGLQILKLILWFNVWRFSYETEQVYIYAILTAILYIYLLGPSAFDSNTEGTFLIGGSLVHESNHPVSAFFWYVVSGAIAGVVGGCSGNLSVYLLIVFTIIGIILNIALTISHIKDNI